MEILSAGGVVYRETRDGGEIVVCGRFDTKSHHLPKGTQAVSYTHLTLPTIYSV